MDKKILKNAKRLNRKMRKEKKERTEKDQLMERNLQTRSSSRTAPKVADENDANGLRLGGVLTKQVYPFAQGFQSHLCGTRGEPASSHYTSTPLGDLTNSTPSSSRRGKSASKGKGPLLTPHLQLRAKHPTSPSVYDASTYDAVCFANTPAAGATKPVTQPHQTLNSESSGSRTNTPTPLSQQNLGSLSRGRRGSSGKKTSARQRVKAHRARVRTPPRSTS